jgi:hypothetical protein
MSRDDNNDQGTPMEITAATELFPISVIRRRMDDGQRLAAVFNGTRPQLRKMITRLVVCKRRPLKLIRELVFKAGVKKHTISDFTFVSDNLLAITVDEEYNANLETYLTSKGLTMLAEDNDILHDTARKYITRLSDCTDCLIERHERARTCKNVTQRTAMLQVISKDIKAFLLKVPDKVLLYYVLTCLNDAKETHPDLMEVGRSIRDNPHIDHEEAEQAFIANEERKERERREREARRKAQTPQIDDAGPRVDTTIL